MVGADGRVAGTVGGGTIELASERIARRMARDAGSEAAGCRHFSLSPEAAGSVGMVCGGETDLLFTPVPFALTEPLRAALGVAGAALALPLDGSAPEVLAGEGAGTRDRIEAGARVEVGGREAVAVPLAPEGMVYVFGGGHVAQALVPMLMAAEFSCTVVDDRPEFCAPALFPAGCRTRCLSYDALEGELTITAEDWVCIMTRGHAGDLEAMRFALGTPARYIGAIGSKQKRERLFGILEGEGAVDVRERVVSPIGLPLGGRRPGEVAISIAAQLVQDRAGAR